MITPFGCSPFDGLARLLLDVQAKLDHDERRDAHDDEDARRREEEAPRDESAEDD